MCLQNAYVIIWEYTYIRMTLLYSENFITYRYWKSLPVFRPERLQWLMEEKQKHIFFVLCLHPFQPPSFKVTMKSKWTIFMFYGILQCLWVHDIAVITVANNNDTTIIPDGQNLPKKSIPIFFLFKKLLNSKHLKINLKCTAW